jgi:peptide/nickel transport system substrate-binding protein
LQWRAQLCALGMTGWLTACGGDGGQRLAADDAFVVLLPREAQEIDPRFAGDAYGHKLSRLLFASLLTVDPWSLAVVPDLASDVTVESATRYRVRLRDRLRFSDGSALDADDVAATFRSVVDPKLATRYAQSYKRIARIEVVSKREIVFELDGPHATFLTDLELPIMRAEDAHRRVGRLGGEPPIGAGPYVLLEREAGRVELGPNALWYGGAPLHPRVRMLVVRDDNTRALRMLAGAGDLSLNAVPPLLLPLFERDPRFLLSTARGVGTSYVGINLEAERVRDLRVRRAIAHAIDRAAIVKHKLGGRAQLASSWIVPGHWAFSADTPSYGYDPARARALLAEAGWLGPGRPRLRLSMRCGNDRSRQSIARAIAAMLGDLGIEVELRPSEVATLVADLARGRFELTTLEVPEVVEPHVLQFFFGSDRVPGAGREGGNRWRIRNAELDAAFERGRASIDEAVRKHAYARAQRILAEQLPVIPLWHEDVVAVEARSARDFVVPRLARFAPLAAGPRAELP